MRYQGALIRRTKRVRFPLLQPFLTPHCTRVAPGHRVCAYEVGYRNGAPSLAGEDESRESRETNVNELWLSMLATAVRCDQTD